MSLDSGKLTAIYGVSKTNIPGPGSFVSDFCAYIDSVPPDGPSLVGPQGLLLRQKPRKTGTKSKGPASNHAESVLLLTGCYAFPSTCIISVNSKFLNLKPSDAWPAPVDQASCGLLIHPRQVSVLVSRGKTIENPAVRALP